MTTVGSYEAKTHLPKLLEKVAKGERIIITKHGLPVAELVPSSGRGTTDVKTVIKELKKLRKKIRLGGLSLRDMIEEGRRF
jgi:prevent-host-death family protein